MLFGMEMGPNTSLFLRGLGRQLSSLSMGAPADISDLYQERDRNKRMEALQGIAGGMGVDPAIIGSMPPEALATGLLGHHLEGTAAAAEAARRTAAIEGFLGAGGGAPAPTPARPAGSTTPVPPAPSPPAGRGPITRRPLAASGEATRVEAPGVTYATDGKIRDLPVDERIISGLSSIGSRMGVGVQITSGGQRQKPPAWVRGGEGSGVGDVLKAIGERTGSTRHDVDDTGYGQAADFILTRDGRPLSPRDHPKLYERFIEEAAKKFPGVGHYNGHLHAGYGSERFWGPSGRVVDANPEFRAAYDRGRAAAGTGTAGATVGGVRIPSMEPPAAAGAGGAAGSATGGGEVASGRPLGPEKYDTGQLVAALTMPELQDLHPLINDELRRRATPESEEPRPITPEERAAYGLPEGEPYVMVNGTPRRISTSDGGVEINNMPDMSEGEAKNVSFYRRSLNLLPQLAEVEEELLALDASLVERFLGSTAGNFYSSEGRQRAKGLANLFLAVVLRRDTGAAVTEAEFDLYAPIFLPMPGDTPEVLAQKRELRENEVRSIRYGTGDGYKFVGEIDSEFESRYGYKPFGGATEGGAPPPSVAGDGTRGGVSSWMDKKTASGFDAFSRAISERAPGKSAAEISRMWLDMDAARRDRYRRALRGGT